MKKQNSLVLLASAILVAMTLASCKMGNKPAAEASRIGEIPEAAQYIVGIEKYDTVIDYSQAACWLGVPAVLVKDGVLATTPSASAEGSTTTPSASAEGLKPVDVFYPSPASAPRPRSAT